MEEGYAKMETKLWQLEQHMLFLDEEMRRLRAGEPSRRVPVRDRDTVEEDDEIERLFRR